MVKTLIIRNVPPELHKQLKIKVAQEGTSINAAIIDLIKQYVKQK